MYVWLEVKGHGMHILCLILALLSNRLHPGNSDHPEQEAEEPGPVLCSG